MPVIGATQGPISALRLVPGPVGRSEAAQIQSLDRVAGQRLRRRRVRSTAAVRRNCMSGVAAVPAGGRHRRGSMIQCCGASHACAATRTASATLTAGGCRVSQRGRHGRLELVPLLSSLSVIGPKEPGARVRLDMRASGLAVTRKATRAITAILYIAYICGRIYHA